MGKERLAAPGYYIEYYGKVPYNFVKDSTSPTETFGVTYISPAGKCSYIHWMAPTSNWYGLLWSCAPTKKKIEKSIQASSDKECERYLHFATHEELCQFPYIDHKPHALVRSPIDN